MNIGTDGNRYIAHLEQYYKRTAEFDQEIAKYLTDDYDEVYVMGLDINNQDFINEIVLRGCRI